MSVETDPTHDPHCPTHWECLDCGLPAGRDHEPDDMCRSRDERCDCGQTR